MKAKALKLTSQQLLQLLQGKPETPLTLPDDAELLDLKYDLLSRQICAIIRSETYEDITQNTPLPELTCPQPAEPKPEPKPAPTPPPKTEFKPEISPSIAKPIQPQISRYAQKMENEFSPEQRKLLSFTVKDNFVVVKPVTFLKAEWEDVNEVVRSLGGRWVKGDIISYWEIPLQ